MSKNEIDFEQEATLQIRDRNQNNITLPLEDIAKILLSPSDLAKCYTQIYTATLFGKWNYSYGKAAANHWQKAIGRNNQNITWTFSYKFEWGKARQRIMRKYGATAVNYEGRKTAATGLHVKSILSNPTDAEPHIKRIGELMRDFKKGTGNSCYLFVKGCVVQGTCHPEVMRLLLEHSK